MIRSSRCKMHRLKEGEGRAVGARRERRENNYSIVSAFFEGDHTKLSAKF